MYTYMNLKFLNQPLGQGDMSAGYAPQKKPWISAAIMAASAIASAIYSSYKSSQANKKAQAQLDAEKSLTESEKRRRMMEARLYGEDQDD